MYVDMIISKCESFNCSAFIWKSRFGFGKGHMNDAAHDDSIFFRIAAFTCSYCHRGQPLAQLIKPKANKYGDSILSDKPQTRINRSLNSKHCITADIEAQYT